VGGGGPGDGPPVADPPIRARAGATGPGATVLAIDASGSMSGAPLEAAKAAATSFVQQAGNTDQIAIITFADEVQTLSGFTADKQVLTERFSSIQAAGETSFNDAVIRGVSLFDSVRGSSILANMIVLTDGEDTVSQASLEEALAAVSERSVRVFGVALEGSDFNPEPVQRVAEAGGGLFLSTPDPSQLSSIYNSIGSEISNTQVARFRSPVFLPGEAEFAVSYEGLTAARTFPVSGFAT